MELDAVKLDPNRYKLVLENRLVRVMRLRFEAREAGSMVRHPPRVLATLTHVWIKLSFADGRRDERSVRAEIAAWLEEETLLTDISSTSSSTRAYWPGGARQHLETTGHYSHAPS